jgi:TonB family protein
MFRLVVLGVLLTVGLCAEDVVRVSEAEAKKNLVTKADPEYPALARQAHVTGRVTVDVYVDEQGTVESAKPVSGNLLLSGAAVNATKKWKFSPSGKKTVAQFAFDFKL